MLGWTGKILRIDLTKGNCSVEDLPSGLARDYIGGRGLGDRILFDEIDPTIDALSPENKLIFATGPLTGTGVPAGGRFVVVGKSPLTGAVGNPCCGGYFGANLKFAGYDALILEGKAPEPVYITVINDRVDLRPAARLWGKNATETEHAIRADMGPEADRWEKNMLSIACIGPAGENLVRFACVMADGGRAAGRSGMGAVMGSKNVKAIAAHGTGEVKVAEPEAFRKAVELLRTHQSVFVFGVGPSVSLVDLLEIRLTRSARRVFPLKTFGREMVEPLLLMSEDDLLIAIAWRSMNPYLHLVLKVANEHKTPVILVTDTLGDLVSYNKSDLMKFRNFGKKSLTELDELLESMSLSFGMDVSKYKLEKD